MDILKEIFDVGLGVVVLTKEKTEKAVKELVKKGKIKQKEGEKLVEELLKKSKVEGKEIEGKIAKAITKMFSKLDVATKEDIERLEKEIKKLKKSQK